jgi:alkylation response protein AidB-like acyl-CoA dehydrogenase
MNAVGCAGMSVTASLSRCHAHRLVGSHCLQVCGAMGLTWEHDLHRYLRRGYTLDAVFGTANAITECLGAQLIARAETALPRYPENKRTT